MVTTKSERTVARPRRPRPEPNVKISGTKLKRPAVADTVKTKRRPYTLAMLRVCASHHRPLTSPAGLS